MYVVVTVGDTLVEPVVLGVTDPMPLSMLVLSAPDELHESRELSLVMIPDGSADMSTVGRPPISTVTLSVADPYSFSAVIVYVVVTTGYTAVLPFKATEPIPWFIITLSAEIEFHESVAEEPADIVVSSAEMLTAGSTFTLTVALSVLDP